MAKIIKFPGGGGPERKKPDATESIQPSELGVDAKLALLRSLSVTLKASGVKFNVDSEKYFEDRLKLNGLLAQVPDSVRGRNQALYKGAIDSMPDQALLDTYNHSSELDWSQKPVYWSMVHRAILDRDIIYQKSESETKDEK